MFQKKRLLPIQWLKNANVTNRIHETKSHFDDVEPMTRHEILCFVTPVIINWEVSVFYQKQQVTYSSLRISLFNKFGVKLSTITSPRSCKSKSFVHLVQHEL